MTVLTIRDKNQVTVPAPLMESVGLKRGDPIEFEALPDGGIGIYPFGHEARRTSLWDLAVQLGEQIPGLDDTELDLPARRADSREVVW